MELIKCPAGASLDLSAWVREHLTDTSVERTRQRISIACSVSAGMAFVHSKGYIHADLKPGNVSGGGPPSPSLPTYTHPWL